MGKVILTGTACAGKSTLLSALAQHGYQVVPEAETPIVEALAATLGKDEAIDWMRSNYTEFKRQVGERQKEIERDVSLSSGSVIFDRSAVCYIAYCKLRNAHVPRVLYDLACEPPPEQVFFLERLVNFDKRSETGRFMTESEADELAVFIKKEYELRCTQLIFVPRFSSVREESIARRLDYVMRCIDK